MGQIFRGTPIFNRRSPDTYTLGVIWEPFPDLSGTLDYWNIVTKQQITVTRSAAGARQSRGVPARDRCFATITIYPGIPNSGTLLSVAIPYQNGDNIKTDGIDLDVVWRQTLGDWGNLRTELQWTHVFRYTSTFNGQSFEFAGTQGTVRRCSSAAGTPMDRVEPHLGWARGPWNVTGTLRYVSDYDFDRITAAAGRGRAVGLHLSRIDGPDCHVASFTTLDLSALLLRLQELADLRLGHQRLQPHRAVQLAAAYGGVNYNYNYAFSGATGTQFNLGFRYTFE